MSVFTVLNVKVLASTDQAKRELDSFANQANQAGNKLSNVGNKMTMGVTLPLVGLGAAAIKSSADFERTMNSMAAVAGVPAPQIEKLSALAMKLGADTVFSAGEAATAMLELGKAGVSTADIMGGGLKNALDLATAGDLELAEASTIMANAMNTFGIQGKDAKVAADALAGAANASSADVRDLAMGLAQGGLAAKNAGFSIQETTGVLAAFSMAGMQGSDAGTSLKTMLMGLVPTTGKAAGLIEELGLDFLDASGNIRPMVEIAESLKSKLGHLNDEQQQTALKVIFGTDAYRAASIMMTEGAAGMSKYVDATSDVGAASDVASGKMKGLPGVIEQMKGSFETLLLVASKSIVPMFQAVAKWATELFNKFNALSPATQKLVVMAALLLAAIGPVAKIIGGITKAVGLLGKALSFLAANPVVLVIAAIAGLVYLVVKYWDEIKAAFKAATEWIGAHLGEFGRILLAVLTGGLSELVMLVVRRWDDIKAVTATVWSGIKDFFGGLWDKITGPFEAAWQGMADFFAGVWEGVKSVVKGVINFIIGGVNRMIRGLNKVGELAGKIPGVPDFRINELPMLAKGGTAIASGSAIVGEEGPEMIHMGRGASVVPLNGASGGGVTHNHYYTIQGSVWSERELAEVIRKQQSRTGIRNVSAFGGVA